MNEEKVKGSIGYQILIVVLAAMLVTSIIYPKKIKDQEEFNIQVSRSRMSEIQNTEFQYLKYNGVYTDSAQQLIEFIRTSPEYASYVDSVIIGGVDSVITRLNELTARQKVILSNIPSATDTVMIDSLSQMQQTIKGHSRQLAGFIEFIHDRMKNLPNMPLDDLTSTFRTVDSKQFTLTMDIVKNSIESGNLQDAEKAAEEVIDVVQSVIDRFQLVKKQIPEYKGDSLEELFYCPTTGKPYRLVKVDTSIFKFLNIYCPIDSSDIEKVENDFLKSKIAGLKLQNHGKIENGEKSWEART